MDPDGREGEFIPFYTVFAVASADALTPDPTDVLAPAKGAGYTGALIGTAIGGTINLIFNAALNESTEVDAGASSGDGASGAEEIDRVGERIKELVGENPTTEDVKKLEDKGFVWKGKPGESPGSDKGAFVNPETKEQIHNDLDSHSSGTARGPHITYTDSDGKRYDYFPESKNIERQ